MPSQVNLPAILHLRDFINSVGPDPSRPDQGLALQIEASLHLPFQSDLYSDDVELTALPTTIRIEVPRIPLCPTFPYPALPFRDNINFPFSVAISLYPFQPFVSCRFRASACGACGARVTSPNSHRWLVSFRRQDVFWFAWVYRAYIVLLVVDFFIHLSS
jgi:hypothetical protein